MRTKECMRLLLFACAGIVRPFRAGGPLRCGQPGYSIIAPRSPHGRRSLIRATEDDVEEARRFLDLADDPDVERYLRDGKSALGRQVALVLPRDDSGVEAAMMLAARKLVKLGASVRVVKPEADLRQLSGAAPYPRVEQVTVDLHDADRVGRALLGVHWLLLGASVDDETAASLGAAMAEHSEGDSVVQLVVLSSVSVYGEAMGEAGCGAELSEAALEARELDGAGAEAHTLRSGERQLAALPPPCCTVLRACPPFDVGVPGAPVSGAPLRTGALLSDAIGLQELLSELRADLRSRLGGAAAPSEAGRGTEERKSLELGIATLLPPGGTAVQLTHVADLAGAAVFACLTELGGTYHVCSAPGTLQQLFDATAAHRGWQPFALRDEAAASSSAGATAAVFSTAKLRQAGYELLWAEMTPPAPSSAGQHGAQAAPGDGVADGAEPGAGGQ
jgi:hypothetical protein